jgi:hypothetical protein
MLLCSEMWRVPHSGIRMRNASRIPLPVLLDLAASFLPSDQHGDELPAHTDSSTSCRILMRDTRR